MSALCHREAGHTKWKAQCADKSDEVLYLCQQLREQISVDKLVQLADMIQETVSPKATVPSRGYVFLILAFGMT